jgi:hypothetical protein
MKEEKKEHKFEFLFYVVPGAILFFLDKYYFHFFD